MTQQNEPDTPTTSAEPTGGRTWSVVSSGENVPSRAWTVLAVTTLAFFVNFWAWALLAPLAPSMAQRLNLTSVTQSIVVALPVLIGSIGRVPAGALTDRYGARTIFTVFSALTIIPVLGVGFFGDSLPLLLVGAVLLGIGGTTFSIGVPAVNSWFPASRRGAALGIFGMGTGGTALASFSTLPLTNAFGPTGPFVTVAIALAVVAVLCATLLRARKSTRPTGSMLRRTWDSLKLRVTWQLSVLYAVTFGGFVAFSVYLPTYLQNEFTLAPTDAALRTAGFIVLAVLARPIGGWLCDRMPPTHVLGACCVLAGVFAGVAAFGFALLPIGTIVFLGLAAVLGAGSGAVLALVSHVTAADQVGTVTGVVGAAGGLGGFFPPLVMGLLYQSTGNYALGFALLGVAALAGAALVYTLLRRKTA